MPRDRSPLPPDVADLLRRGRGVLSTSEAESLGVTRARLARLADAEALVRLARGVYADAVAYGAADEWRTFELKTRAFTLACGPLATAGGWSAGSVWRLPTIGSPPELPLALVPTGSGVAGDSRYGRVRKAALPPQHRVVVKGCLVTTLPRTVIDIARSAPRADALVVADAALTTKMTAASLRNVLEVEAGWRDVTAAAWVTEHADAYAESALETLGRLTFLESDLPVPLSNAWVDVAGGASYRVDHLLADRWLAFEGDGSLKYDDRSDAGRVIAEQREREWRLREAGIHVVRYGWQLARYDRNKLATRFAAVIAEHPPRPEPCSWRRNHRPSERLADVA